MCALHNRKQRAFYVKALDKMILFYRFFIWLERYLSGYQSHISAIYFPKWRIWQDKY